MKKSEEQTKIKQNPLTIKLPGETVTIGPGTVPTSLDSVQTTVIEDVVKGFRKAANVGLFDNLLQDATK